MDIDGNDYWVLEAIQAVSPAILIVEYNALFGAEKALSVPYKADFTRSAAHFSNLYYGASLPALTALAERKGYRLVGCNSAGNNAFFVRADLLGPLQPLAAAAAFVASRFCESRNADGSLSFLRGRAEKLALLRDLPLVDVTTGREHLVGELFAGELAG